MIGGGPAGLVSAIALVTAGVDTLLVAPSAPADHRTTALLAGSAKALETLGVWQGCVGDAAPLRKIRIVDDTRRLIRGPEVAFDAAEIGLDAFGYNIENRHLIAALEARAGALELARIAAPALAVTSDQSGVSIKHADGEARVRLAIGADGARSLCRTATGISSTRHSYPQAALTLNLSPCATAPRYVDRISYRAGPLHARSPARPALQSRLRDRPCRCDCAFGHERRRTVRRD